MDQAPPQLAHAATERRQRAIQRLGRRIHHYQRRILIGGIVAIGVGLVVLQVWPYGRDHTNPPVVKEPLWDSPQTRALAVRACFDCHSNETQWPWYTHVAPISMMVYQDVVKGREAVNFSNWNDEAWTSKQTERMIEVINKNQMPLPYYLILHPTANLSSAEKGQLVNGMIATLSSSTVENSQSEP